MKPIQRSTTSPGEMLLEEFLKPRRIIQQTAAIQLGISIKQLNEIIRGKRGMTITIARRLAKLLDTTPQFWMNLGNP